MVLTETPSARAASPADRNSFFFIHLFYESLSILVNGFLRSSSKETREPMMFAEASNAHPLFARRVMPLLPV
jgi:hypothetical protein